MSTRLYHIIIGCIVLMGCTGRNAGDNGYEMAGSIIYSESTDTICSKYVSNIRYLTLQESNRHILPDVTKIKEEGGKLFIFSKLLRKINVHSADGHFLYEVNRQGHGPNEYMEIANFTVKDTRLYIIDNISHCINIYDTSDGHFIDKRPISFVAWDMETIGKDEFLFTFSPNNPLGVVDMKQPKGMVWRTDSTFAISRQYLTYPNDYCEKVGKNYYFTTYGGKVIFHCFRHNGFFVFNEEGGNPQYHDVSGGIMLTETPYITNDYILLSMGDDEYDEPYLLDKSKGALFKNREEDASNLVLFPSAIICNQPAYYLTDYDLYEELTMSGFQKADAETEKILASGGACFIIYSLESKDTDE